MIVRERLIDFGFDWDRLTFALRCAVGSCLALLLAWLAGLEHPQWAAMTVWAASQPTRGLLVEKSLFRVAGTFVGTGIGVLMVLVAGDNTLLLAVALALWVATCAGAGNVLRGLVGYGTLLAGYSASMVALLGTRPDATILAIGTDRLLTILLGVTVALVVGLLLGGRHAGRSDLRSGVVRTGIATLHALGARLEGRETSRLIDLDGLVTQIAALEEGLDEYGAGSLQARRAAQALHAALTAQMEIVLWLKHPRRSTRQDDAAAAMVNRMAAELEKPSAEREPVAATALVSLDGELGSAADTLMLALSQREPPRQGWLRLRRSSDDEATCPRIRRRVVPHRDWVYARHAFARTGGLLLLIGVVWAVTGAAVGAYVMLGTAVMVTLFSTFENPAWIMRNIIFWQAVGAVAALLCRWLLWPHAGSELVLILMMMPLIFLGALPVAHRRTMWGAMDYIMVMLLLLQPALPLSGTLPGSLAIALAVVTGPVLAWIAFKVAFPTDAERRWQRLRGMMIGELDTIASAGLSTRREAIWQARLYHRAMKLVHWNSKLGQAARGAVNGALAVLDLGRTAMQLRGAMSAPALADGERRAVQLALGRLAQVGEAPAQAIGSLERVATRLQRRDPALAAALTDSAALLRENRGFFEA